MKYIDEYREPEAALAFSKAIHRLTTGAWTIMEVCGGQTHSIVKYGIDELLPAKLNLVHGPGCPVCVTPLNMVEKALSIASVPEVVFCSFGDMLRVPGFDKDLLSVKATGGDIRVVYSPLDALRIAEESSDREVVFFAVGFETTAPANAMAAFQARQRGLENFSMLVSHVLVPPAIEAILSSPDNRVQGFLAAGHVCAVMGYEEYEPIASRYRVPIVVTGFEPLDLLHGIAMCIRQLEEGRVQVENQYRRTVRRQGNPSAKKLIREVFEVVPRHWRGIGEIARSGLGLNESYAKFDAERRFNVEDIRVVESSQCVSGRILQGTLKPIQCPAFGDPCTPEHPLGATMVSSEGACAAYYRYRRSRAPEFSRREHSPERKSP
jgi:hydrogenase expression/formation protein HypD